MRQAFGPVVIAVRIYQGFRPIAKYAETYRFRQRLRHSDYSQLTEILRYRFIDSRKFRPIQGETLVLDYMAYCLRNVVER